MPVGNALYPEWKEFLLSGALLSSLNVNDAIDGPFCALATTYVYSAAHSFYSPSVTGVVGTDQRITSPTVANGVFDGADLTFPSVTGATVNSLVIYRHNSGLNTTWKLVAYLDTGFSGLPVIPNGGNITVAWANSPAGIFGL
jgi:hypothetical protein